MLIYIKNSYVLCWYFLIFNVLEMEMEGVLLERADLGLSPRKNRFPVCPHPAPPLPPPRTGLIWGVVCPPERQSFLD